MRPLRDLHEHLFRRRRLGLLAATATLCLSLAGAGPALAEKNPLNKINKEEFAKFVNCPIAESALCLYAEVLSGEFKIGNKAVPLTNPTTLQGGQAHVGGTSLAPILAPLFGAETLSAVSQPVPGGLTGLTASIGGPVSATAELAGTPNASAAAIGYGLEQTAVELPIKVHLENENLGPNCYIGSDADPIVLKLTDATTKPPAGTEPISGKVGTNEGRDKGRLLTFIDNTMVDNTFAVPAATGCGTNALLEPIITAAVNADEGLPAEPGKSYAILTGNQYATYPEWVAKYDAKLLKEKSKVKKTKKYVGAHRQSPSRERRAPGPAALRCGRPRYGGG